MYEFEIKQLDKIRSAQNKTYKAANAGLNKSNRKSCIYAR